jgi:hypothetical protein
MDKAKHWQELIDLQKTSGQTRKVFCDERKINLHTLTYWKQKLSGKKSSKKTFAAVKVKDSPSTTCEIITPSGYTIQFESTLTLSKLKSIIEMLK